MLVTILQNPEHKLFNHYSNTPNDIGLDYFSIKNSQACNS